MKIKNILISIIMVGLASYGGLKLYMWDKAKKDVNNFFAGFSAGFTAGTGLQADAKYDRIATSVYGPVGVRGVSIRMPEIEEEITIDEVLLHERESLEDLKNGKIPGRLHFTISGMKMSTSYLEKKDAITRKLLRQNNIPLYDQDSVLYRLGYHRILDRTGNLWDLGYDQVTMDIEFDLIINRTTKEALITYHQNIHELGDITARVKLADMSNSISSAVLGMRIKDATISFKDDSYMERLLKLFANEHDMEIEEFREKLPAMIEGDFTDKKLKLSEESVANIKRFIRDPHKLIFTIYPYRPVGIESIKHYKPGDVPMLLNLQAHLE